VNVEEISLHLMDIVENSLMAGASLISVDIEENPAADLMAVTIVDDGRGMAPEFLAKVTDPFVTTRDTRRVGLGLSLMQANARAWGGDLTVQSAPGQGTTVKIWFSLTHLDRPPLGNWPATLFGLILTRQGVDFVYRHKVAEDEIELDTRELKAELGEGALADPAVIALLREQTREALAQMESDQARLLPV
jgi:sensor histidine kinase YesM